MARPRKLELRDRQLNLSLSATEYDSLVERAKALGMRVSHLGRALVLNSNASFTPHPKNSSNLEKLNYSALVRLGNNLNQLVRYLHQTGDPLPADLEPLLRDIRDVIARGLMR